MSKRTDKEYLQDFREAIKRIELGAEREAMIKLYEALLVGLDE